MLTTKGVKLPLTKNIKAALRKEPGLTVKDLADRLEINRQFMAGSSRSLKRCLRSTTARSDQQESTSTRRMESALMELSSPDFHMARDTTELWVSEP